MRLGLLFGGLLSTSRAFSGLLQKVRQQIQHGDSDAAMESLIQAYTENPQATGLSRLWQECLELRVEQNPHAQDLIGLASLWMDQEGYEQASKYLQQVFQLDEKDEVLLERASSMLFRSNKACCQWNMWEEDSKKLVEALRDFSNVPSLHPFAALQIPCISIDMAAKIASSYASRSMRETGNVLSTATNDEIQSVFVSRSKTFARTEPIRVGYLSPDFTSKHPLAFLMQDFFGLHDHNNFQVYLYSLGEPDDGPEVAKIRDGSDSFVHLAGSVNNMAQAIQTDELDVLVDLCGYTGTDMVAQIMSLRTAPIQVSYMGFPSTTAAPYMDYFVCDETVVPPFLRQYYTESLVFMPHSYFVNSHRGSVAISQDPVSTVRSAYGLPEDAFVFCCHSRASKLDPYTVSKWFRALKRMIATKRAVLWLLSSGPTMEKNLLQLARQEGLPEESMVFCPVASREEHLRRLTASDVFLDTPAYNAHTLGCDTLHAGVPMISLLHPDSTESDAVVATEKLSSRVGASLLKAAGLDCMIASSMREYEDLMVRCACDTNWFQEVTASLSQARASCHLFDTAEWVRDFELALKQAVEQSTMKVDIRISES